MLMTPGTVHHLIDAFLLGISIFIGCTESPAKSVVTSEAILLNSQIEEASGIVYSQFHNSLFIVDDEGMLYQMSTDGIMMKQIDIGDYDFEGITQGLNPNDFLLVAESTDEVIQVKSNVPDYFVSNRINPHYKGSLVLGHDDGNGIEGIHRNGNTLYVVNQSSDSSTKTDASVLIRLGSKGDSKWIEDVIQLPIHDMSGITSKGGKLYIISDDEDMVYALDEESGEVLARAPLPVDGDQEGITFDTEGTMYIAVEEKGIFKVSNFNL